MEGFKKAIEKYNPRSRLHDGLFQLWFEMMQPFTERVITPCTYYWGPEIISTWKKRVFAGIDMHGTCILVHVFKQDCVSITYMRDEIASIPTMASFETGYITEWMEYNLAEFIPTHPREKLYAIVNYVKYELRTLPRDRYLDLSPANIWCDFQDILFFCDFGLISADDKSTHPDLHLANPDPWHMALYSIGTIFKHCETMHNISFVLCQAEPKNRVFNRTVVDTLEFLLEALKS